MKFLRECFRQNLNLLGSRLDREPSDSGSGEVAFSDGTFSSTSKQTNTHTHGLMVVCRSLKETFSYSHRLLVVSAHLNRADRKQAGVLRQVLIYLISFSWFFPALECFIIVNRKVVVRWREKLGVQPRPHWRALQPSVIAVVQTHTHSHKYSKNMLERQ